MITSRICILAIHGVFSENQRYPYLSSDDDILGDMNGLKLVNDTFGHEEGDKALRK
jgi:hypothetical protein